MNVAQLVRQHLAGARAAGIAFDDAWDQAVAAALGPAPHPRASAQRRERAEWFHAWSRAAFEAAYHGEPRSRAEAAARDLEELVA